MVNNIREVKEDIGITTNAGELKTNMRAMVPAYGEVWYHPKAITNIFSFAEMEDKHPIKYDSTADHAFILQLSDKTVRFKRSQNGLYLFKTPYIKNNQLCATNVVIDSVEDNMKISTNRQVQQEKLGRQVYHAFSKPLSL